MKKKICLVIFIVLFVVSILVNVKLLFFSPAVSLKNIPFEGVITEADSGKNNNFTFTNILTTNRTMMN